MVQSNRLFPNKIMLITYPDSMGGNLKTLNIALQEYFKGAVGGIHLLPFFPSSGDRGFSPITYQQVNHDFGTWEDVHKLSETYYLMCDIMVNHISRQSSEFQDFLKNKDASPYAPMFLDYQAFWGPMRPTQEDLELLYRRKNGEPYQSITFLDGEVRKLWCTFTPEQLDIDTTQLVTRQFLLNNLQYLIERGISIIRLDAYGYVTKRKDTNCFFVEPDIWELITYLRDVLLSKRALVLPEVHDTWHISKKFEEHDIWSYDFVLPFLMLHTIYSRDITKLVNWLQTCPRTQFTVLDTHDGVGVYDAYGWVNNQETDQVIVQIEDRLSYSYKPLHPEKKQFYKAYQLYGTYYSMLHERDDVYLLTRAIQFFAPGIPQVYYVGMLAGENDLDALEQNVDHRSINRHNYTLDELEYTSHIPLVQELLSLMRFRNTHSAFDGEIEVVQISSQIMQIIRQHGEHKAVLNCNLKDYSFTIHYSDTGLKKMQLWDKSRS